ncbi:MAG: hypothetical protein L6Q99_04905 [Planctomycetes bacterium]|nr:hypothetical protein [Planctomycetota bacterium]
MRRTVVCSCLGLLVSSFTGACGSGSSTSSVAPPTQATGHFADPPVSGLAYSTPTFSGVTDASGAFQFMTGEDISFAVGSLQLGTAVPAKSKMNAFDLVPGATEPLRAADVRRFRSQSASNAPDLDMQRAYEATNILAFLHSLDADADPTTGIELDMALVPLVDAADLDLRLPSQKFAAAFGFQALRYRAFEQGLVPSARLVHPYRAYDRHCAGRNLTPQIWFDQRMEVDWNADSMVDRLVEWTIDSRGFSIEQRVDSTANGSFDEIEKFQYTDDGDLVERWYDDNGDGAPDTYETRQFDLHGNQVQSWTDTNGDGAFDRLVYSTFDANGALGKYELDQNADGAMDVTAFHTYDAEGNRTKVETDTDGNGQIDRIETRTFDATGHPLSILQDGNGDGFPEQIVWYAYDSFGNPISYEVDVDADGVVDMRTEYSWDAKACMTRQEFDGDADGVFDEVTTWSYDGSRRTTRFRVDHGGDGNWDEVDTFSYVDDAEGNEIIRDEDHGDDGTINYHAETIYGAENQQMGRRIDTNGNGLFDYLETMTQGRGALFGTVLAD